MNISQLLTSNEEVIRQSNSIIGNTNNVGVISFKVSLKDWSASVLKFKRSLNVSISSLILGECCFNSAVCKVNLRSVIISMSQCNHEDFCLRLNICRWCIEEFNSGCYTNCCTSDSSSDRSYARCCFNDSKLSIIGVT